MGRSRQFDEQDILERATRWVWRNGFASTSMRDIEAATGLGKASIYNAYGSREAFFHALLNYYVEKRQEQSLALLSQQRSGRSALDAYLTGILQTPSDESYLSGCLLVNITAEQTPLDLEAHMIVNRGMTMIEQRLKDTIERGIKDGSIKPDTEPETSAACLMATILGLYVMKRQGICQHKLQELITASLNGLASPKTTLQSVVA